ncbi:MAG: hypothetical protein U9R14_01900 [Patescibacteria group bacterium]|nr:hypothetical protein [Patescibacteria group bacterium]
MANRPVFIPNKIDKPFVAEQDIEFKWIPGMAVSQKMKNVKALHKAALENQNIMHILEISTKSELELGVRLSAFNLWLNFENGKKITVEAAFQGSKVFEQGGPYRNLYLMSGREIKKDRRLKHSGALIGFNYQNKEWPLEPKTAFYDWLYLKALCENKSLSDKLMSFAGFSDIEFNPKKSLNCQARSAALYVAIYNRVDLNDLLKDKNKFIKELYLQFNPKIKAKQNTLF